MPFRQQPERSNASLHNLKQATNFLDGLSLTRQRLAFLFNGCLIVVCSLTLYLIVVVELELYRVPNLNFLEHYQPVGDIQVFDRYDKPVCTIAGTEKRTIIPLGQVTPQLQKAVLAAEDHHFYTHHGIDPLGIGRALLANISKGHAVQGGSTITQQLAKNLFFEDEKRGIGVKIAEAIVASQLEQRFSKEKILELYLNEVYFGNGAYGIEEAANRYFDKNASALTVAESAYIAGLIRAPARGGNDKFYADNISREKDVIDKMLEYHYITREQWWSSQNQMLTFRSRPQKKMPVQITKYPYYVSYVLELVRAMYTEGEMQRHGLKVYTNLDCQAQEAAEKALTYGIRHAPLGCNQGALVSINVRDGAVLALVGGVGDYMKNQWNCATNPHTAGSAFKPFVYLAAFNRGLIKPLSYIEDAPISIAIRGEPDYTPKNYDGKYMGAITITEALAYSRNSCAVRVALQVGIDTIIDTARRAGIKSPLAPQIALALGCSAVSPLEMASAYSTIARGGVYLRPTVLRSVADRNGHMLWSDFSLPDRVFQSDSVAELVDVLQEVVAQGTGTQAKLGNRPVAGKTGTADQAKDLWFVGFTPDLVTAVWGGSTDNKPIAGSHTSGGTVMARIWREYNSAYYAHHEVPFSWFIACTHLAGMRFPTRESKAAYSDKPTKRLPPHVVPDDQIDPPSKPEPAPAAAPTPQPARILKARQGVMDYASSH